MNSEYIDRVMRYIPFVIMGILMLGFLLWFGFHIGTKEVETKEKEAEFQSYLSSHQDSITAYLDGVEVDFTKMDLTKYEIKFNNDLTEMYMTKADDAGSRIYHQLPKNEEDE